MMATIDDLERRAFLAGGVGGAIEPDELQVPKEER